MRVACCGAGGFIGGHLIGSLLADGHEVVAIDIKPEAEWFQVHPESDNRFSKDLSIKHVSSSVINEDFDLLFNLACNMGGMGFLASHRVDCLHSVDITSNVIQSSFNAGVKRFLQTSSACIYPDFKQQTELVSLAESDAWPADPEPAYGLEKLYGEELCKWYSLERLWPTRVVRLHNVYGPLGTWKGGREKAPAAICRKVAAAKLSGNHRISIWGDGSQTRSFMDIKDCIHGIKMIMAGDFADPINLGSSELVSVNQLVTMVEGIAGVNLERTYDLTAPQGVRGRNSDNTLIKATFGWEPSIALQEGMERLYAWIYDQVAADLFLG